jgi:hypothetical protein
MLINNALNLRCATGRLMTFHTTVAVNRSYDLAFTGTNPQSLRLMLPFGAGHPENLTSTRLLVSIFYSNPQQLQVHCARRVVPSLEHDMHAHNSCASRRDGNHPRLMKLARETRQLSSVLGSATADNFSMRKPVITDPCCSNAYAAWENKICARRCRSPPTVRPSSRPLRALRG